MQLFLWCCDGVALACSSHYIVFVCLVVVSSCHVVSFCGVSMLCGGHHIRGVFRSSSCSTFINENRGN